MKEAFEKIRKIFHERVMASELKVRELDDLPFNLRKCYDEMDLEDARSQSFEEALSIVSEVEAEYGKDINVRGNGWIPCSERLPNNTDDVLVTTAYGLVIDAYLSTQKNWCFRNGTRITDLADMPIAWMPLPSPYKPTTD